MKIYSAIYVDWHPLEKFYPKAKCVLAKSPKDLDEPGILVIHGGGDIHPALYNETNKGSYVSDNPSSRDEREWALMKRAIELGILIFGICRGAQMGCALAGGKLIQDVAYHQGNHLISTNDGKTLVTNSIHHQMMYPWTVEHRLIAWTVPSTRTQRFMGITKDEVNAIPEHPNGSKFEPEIVWFPSIGCLAVQGHPEYLPEDHQLNKYIKTQLESVSAFHKT